MLRPFVVVLLKTDVKTTENGMQQLFQFQTMFCRYLLYLASFFIFIWHFHFLEMLHHLFEGE